TCCFFASLKTLLISTKATCLTPKSTSRATFSLAGFQVTLIGRFWVTPEATLGKTTEKLVVSVRTLIAAAMPKKSYSREVPELNATRIVPAQSRQHFVNKKW